MPLHNIEVQRHFFMPQAKCLHSYKVQSQFYGDSPTLYPKKFVYLQPIMIDRATVDKIMEAANIVDVVSEFVTLRKSGANYKGLCPFHNERTPSFYVSPARGICKCFSCGKGGNAVGFIMEHEQMTYPEALRWLANKYHIEIKERELSDEEKREESERESMFIVNEWAANYFEHILHNDVDGMAIGMQYFRSRGFRDDIIKKFRLGYATASRTAMSDEALKKGYSPEFLVKTGLSYRRDDGTLIDRFAGRVIFPWISMSGKVVAFGGRVLDARTKGVNQKYVNSPDSVIYHKDHELYGIYQAKRAIAKEDCVYMVEGYADVISMHQCGIENVVANSGTALNVSQIRILHRFSPNIVLLYDGDAAGIHAALRGTDMLLSEGMNVKVLLLPNDDDPDSFARKHTAADFRQYIADHQTDFIIFKANLLLKNVTDPIKRSEAINSIIRSIAVIHDQIVRASYIKECAQMTGIKEETLIRTMNRFIYNNREAQKKEATREALQANNNEQPEQHADAQQPATQVEKMLIQMVMRHGEEPITVKTEDGNNVTLPIAQYISLDLGADNLTFGNPLYNRVLEKCVEHLNDEGFKASDYFIHNTDMDIANLAVDVCQDRFVLSKSLQEKKDSEDIQQQVFHLVLDFRLDFVNKHINRLKSQLTEKNLPTDKMMSIMAELKDMQTLRNAIAAKIGKEVI